MYLSPAEQLWQSVLRLVTLGNPIIITAHEGLTLPWAGGPIWSTCLSQYSTAISIAEPRVRHSFLPFFTKPIGPYADLVRRRPVTHDESPSAVREALDLMGPLPERGADPGMLLEATVQLLFDHSLFNGHPRFFGYVTAPPAPIGILGDFLAAAVNPNVGAWILSPAATEIESQTVRWIAELIGYPVDCGGLLVSCGNMANFVCFIAARAAKADWNVREEGITADSRRRLRAYGSTETHTWIQLYSTNRPMSCISPSRRSEISMSSSGAFAILAAILHGLLIKRVHIRILFD